MIYCFRHSFESAKYHFLFNLKLNYILSVISTVIHAGIWSIPRAGHTAPVYAAHFGKLLNSQTPITCEYVSWLAQGCKLFTSALFDDYQLTGPITATTIGYLRARGPRANIIAISYACMSEVTCSFFLWHSLQRSAENRQTIDRGNQLAAICASGRPKLLRVAGAADRERVTSTGSESGSAVAAAAATSHCTPQVS